MPRQKLNITVSAFKITETMAAAMKEELEIDPRDENDLKRVLWAEALCARQAKRNIKKFLL